MKRYDIRWANLDPTVGSETRKTRPVVIVSLDALNDKLDTVVICPLTTSLHPAWRSRLQVRAANRHAEIAVDQIRTVSKSRIGDKLDELSEKEAAALRRLIVEMYGE
jgi:mRNA interferase MazF